MKDLTKLAFLVILVAALTGCSSDNDSGVETDTNYCALTDCDGSCVDLQYDPANCGACGTACGDNEACLAGTCTAIGDGGTDVTGGCPDSQIMCGEMCIDPMTDRMYCGAAGQCGEGEGRHGQRCGVTLHELAGDVGAGSPDGADGAGIEVAPEIPPPSSASSRSLPDPRSSWGGAPWRVPSINRG